MGNSGTQVLNKKTGETLCLTKKLSLASDIKEFDKYIDRLPTIFPLIKKDGKIVPSF